MLPWFRTEPAFGLAWKLYLPARKSALLRYSVLATNPPTSMCAPGPTTTPAGLTRNTLPFDCNWPSICEGSLPRTWFRTALLVLGWKKRVVSLGAIEKLFQLMMALAELMIKSWLPFCSMLAEPEATTGATGLACERLQKRARYSASRLCRMCRR